MSFNRSCARFACRLARNHVTGTAPRLTFLRTPSLAITALPSSAALHPSTSRHDRRARCRPPATASSYDYHRHISHQRCQSPTARASGRHVQCQRPIRTLPPRRLANTHESAVAGATQHEFFRLQRKQADEQPQCQFASHWIQSCRTAQRSSRTLPRKLDRFGV